tara:strand:+ start:177 stop:803 length:627 start_codon:yes stop_codon:yes gene_type:complete
MSQGMHGNNNPQGPRTVKLMIAICVILHFIIIPLWMWSYGLADTTGIEVVNYEAEDCDWDNCKIIDMIKFIEDNSNLKYDDSDLPDVVVQNAEQICTGAYLKPMKECDIAGFYDDEQNIIYIRDGPTRYMVEDGFFETVLIHELVHFLQKINGVYEIVECKANLEADAFRIQDDYIDSVGIDETNKNDPLFSIFASMCRGQMPMLGEQ